jgi:hypothetical protein
MLDPAETSLADTVQSQEHPEHETPFSSPTLLKEGADHVAEVLMKALDPEQKQELELSPRASPQKRSGASQCQTPAKKIRGCDFPSHPCWEHPEHEIQLSSPTLLGVLHQRFALSLIDYARLSPQFHRNFAKQFCSSVGPLTQEVRCSGCAKNPFTARIGVSEAVRLLQCEHASTPTKDANLLCVGLVRGAVCDHCGWDKKVPCCEVEWKTAPGTYTWRTVVKEKVGQYTHTVVKRKTGPSGEFMAYLKSAYEALKSHHFLAVWQAWATKELPARMPTSHYFATAVFSMSFKFGPGVRAAFQKNHFVQDQLTLLAIVARTVTDEVDGRHIVNHGWFVFLSRNAVPSANHARKVQCATSQPVNIALLVLRNSQIDSSNTATSWWRRPLSHGEGGVACSRSV